MSANLRCALAVVVFLIAYGLAGNDDYAEAKRQEEIICARAHAPEWCPK